MFKGVNEVLYIPTRFKDIVLEFIKTHTDIWGLISVLWKMKKSFPETDKYHIHNGFIACVKNHYCRIEPSIFLL